MSKCSRRSIMNMIFSSAALTSAAAIPMIASESDPIFAKIETYERALAIRDQASGEWGSVSTSDHEAYAAAEDKFRDAADALEEAEGDLLTTVPTTAAGAAAVPRRKARRHQFRSSMFI
jgi:hypothetical protein